MNSALRITAAVLEGTALGAVFYLGLWLTVRKGLHSTHPAKLFLASLVLRIGISVAGFYYISRGDWRLLVAGMGGFLLSRTCALRLAGGPESKPVLANQQEER
jgi:F1F0 ATPase subunit 2